MAIHRLFTSCGGKVSERVMVVCWMYVTEFAVEEPTDWEQKEELVGFGGRQVHRTLSVQRAYPGDNRLPSWIVVGVAASLFGQSCVWIIPSQVFSFFNKVQSQTFGYSMVSA